MAKFLDEKGLNILWKHIGSKFNTNEDLGLSYSGNKIKLTGKGGVELGSIDATPFIKDGMLDDVAIIDVVKNPSGSGYGYDPDGDGIAGFIVLDGVTSEGKYILFTWNTDGAKKMDLIKASDIMTPYVGSDSIEIAAKTNTISVKQVAADKTKTNKKILVKGGPLATPEMEAMFPNGIDAQTDLQALLSKLFEKEIFPTAQITEGSLSSSFAKPSVVVPNSGQVVEVGTPITIPQFTGYVPSVSKTPRTYTGFTYGYSAANDNSKDAAGNPPSVNFSTTAPVSEVFTVKRTYTLFGKTSSPTTTGTNATATAATIASDATPKVELGTNKVKFEISGPGFTGTIPQTPTYFTCSNLGNTSDSHKVTGLPEKSDFTTTPSPASSEYTITGKYKYFMGQIKKDAATELTSDDIRGFNIKSNFVEPSGVTTIQGSSVIKFEPAKSIAIAVPNGYKLKSITDSMGNSCVDLFIKTDNIKVKLADNTTDYNYTVYFYRIVSDAVMQFKDITIGK